MNVGGYFACSDWIDHGLLLHGGVPTATSGKPSNSLFLLPKTSEFKEVQLLDNQGPHLSHHQSCIAKFGIESHETLILVGGWNGRTRSSKIFAFDLVTKSWSDLKENSKGHYRVDPPVGLSGHTANLINSSLICVIGREGGIKTQRKFGQMFLLHLDLKNKLYWYTESPIMPKSRSGHTASLAPPINNTCNFLIFGGRDIDSLFTCGKWESKMLDTVPRNKVELKKKLLNMPLKSIGKMIGLRYHDMLVITSDFILIHGGRHFQAISGKDVNGHFYICSLGKGSKETWFQILTSEILPRFGHSIALLNDSIYIVGGFSSESDKKATKTVIIPLPDLPDAIGDRNTAD